MMPAIFIEGINQVSTARAGEGCSPRQNPDYLNEFRVVAGAGIEPATYGL